ncbi:hypothetical protein CN639_25695 [Bacillus toyonensis]|nr:hypothetical protein CN639_25695 [Bacillus toyonensis]
MGLNLFITVGFNLFFKESNFNFIIGHSSKHVILRQLIFISVLFDGAITLSGEWKRELLSEQIKNMLTS